MTRAANLSKIVTDANLEGTLDVTGVLTGTSLDISGDIDVDGTTNLDVVDIDGAVDMASTLGVAGVVTANAGVVVDNITIDGTEIDLSSGDLTVDVAGDITLDAGGGQIRFFDDGTEIGVFSNVSSDFLIVSAVQDKDILFNGNDGGAAITALTLDMSDAGTAIFNHDAKITSGNIQFGASGSETGQIEINGGRLLQRSTGDASGLRFDGSAYTPFKNGSASDGTVDIGSTGARYKDLFLSSGVFLGGTGSANELDDYEEGTFTPTLQGSGDNFNPTYVHRSGQYTKVGNRVHFDLRVQSSSRTENGDQVYIGGLPFSATYSDSGNSSACFIIGNGMKSDFSEGVLYANATNTNSVLTVLMSGYNVGSGQGIDNFRQHDLYASHDLRVSGSYLTNS